MANDLRKQDPEAETLPSADSHDDPQDRDHAALRALSAEWARLGAQAPIESPARDAGAATHQTGVDPAPASQDFSPRRFRVRMVLCADGAASAAQTVGRFANEVAAAAFISSKIGGRSSGSSAGRLWGGNAAGDQICYWIETDQETASVKSTHLS